MTRGALPIQMIGLVKLLRESVYNVFHLKKCSWMGRREMQDLGGCSVRDGEIGRALIQGAAEDHSDQDVGI